MNTRKGRTKFNNFQKLLNSQCSSTIVMRSQITRLNPKEDDVVKWHAQEGNITTNIKVKIDFTLPELSATKTVT